MNTAIVHRYASILLAIVSLVLGSTIAGAQTTVFTYQGTLTDAGNPASGDFDMQFKLFDTATVGTGVQQGPTITNPSVTAAAGIFTVQLDFGAGPFSGPPRFLEIGVRPAGSPDHYTLLSPRQPLTSTPYSVRSLNSSVADALSSVCVNCVTSAQVGGVSGSVVTGPIPVASVPAGSGAYVQNTTSQQAASNFNISGDGAAGGTLSADVVSAATQYNIGGSRVLSAPGSNLFAGAGTGNVNTTGADNSFFGFNAGNQATTGSQNAFFGSAAGFENTTGSFNTFFGHSAGNQNTTGNQNTFFGKGAGQGVTIGDENAAFGSNAGAAGGGGQNSYFGSRAGVGNSGIENAFFGFATGPVAALSSNNSFFGAVAGLKNETGSQNTFVGWGAGLANTTGNSNAFFGILAGTRNKDGFNNTMIGAQAAPEEPNLINATAIGAEASVSQSNSLVLGSINGVNDSTRDTKVGIGTTAPTEKLTVKTATDSYGFIHTDGVITVGSYVGGSGVGGYLGTKSNHPLHFFVNNGPAAMTVDKTGNVRVINLGGAGATQLCRNASNQISTCSSSLRYKKDVEPFGGGLNIVNRLRPISFTWKDGGIKDVGFAAEEVEKIEPLLTTRNDKGEIEGVKYGQVTTVLVNALKEQQTEIEQLQDQIKLQQKQIGNLKKPTTRARSKASSTGKSQPCWSMPSRNNKPK